MVKIDIENQLQQICNTYGGIQYERVVDTVPSDLLDDLLTETHELTIELLNKFVKEFGKDKIDLCPITYIKAAPDHGINFDVEAMVYICDGEMKMFVSPFIYHEDSNNRSQLGGCWEDYNPEWNLPNHSRITHRNLDEVPAQYELLLKAADVMGYKYDLDKVHEEIQFELEQ